MIKKIYLSVITLMLVFVTLGTVVFAWDGLHDINSLDGLSLSASGGNELQISLDGINFSAELTADQIHELFENIQLIDVTTTDGISFQTGGMRDEGEAIPNEHYLSFELWFQTTVREKHIYLINNVSDQAAYDTTSTGTYVTSVGVRWKAKYDFWYGPEEENIITKGEEDQYYAKDSIRIGANELVDEANLNDVRQPEELQQLIFDPTENELRSFGKPYGAYSYFVTRTGKYLAIPNVLPNTSFRLTEIDPDNPYLALDNESLIAVLQETGEFTENGKSIKRGKVRINIWLEGWDADAFDAIENDRVKIQLQFKALLPPELQD